MLIARDLLRGLRLVETIQQYLVFSLFLSRVLLKKKDSFPSDPKLYLLVLIALPVDTF